MWTLMPKEPPTSLQTTRTCDSSRPRWSAAIFCTMCGACVPWEIVSLASAAFQSASTARGDHSRQGFSLPADVVDRDRVLGCRLKTLQVRQHANPWCDNGRQLFACHDGDDPRQALCPAGIDPDDSRVCVRRAQERDMSHAWQLHVADIKPAPLHQPLKVRPWDDLPYLEHRHIHHR